MTYYGTDNHPWPGLVARAKDTRLQTFRTREPWSWFRALCGRAHGTRQIGAWAICLFLTACSVNSGAGPLTANGVVVLVGGNYETGLPCQGEGRTDVVREGGQVYVEATDVAGPVATGTLGVGRAETGTTCVLPFTVVNIPRGFEQYRVGVFDPYSGLLGEIQHLREGDLGKRLTIQISVGAG